jgi:thioredoxin-like negative regulator of GroEL
MSNFILFTLLTMLTGSPLIGLVVVLLIWWLGDRVTFRVLPDPLRWVARWQRRAALRRTLADNPSDRRARFELADLLLEAGRPAEAVSTLRYNVEAGDDDVYTAFLWGAALGRSGQAEQAERALAVARAADPRFRAGEIDLELGRQRLARRDLAGAREALERLLELRPGTVEGRWLLARSLDGLGDAAGAALRRDQAWAEYAALPRFQRRAQRPYAWRIRPWRPALVALAVLLALALAASALGG